MTACADGTFKLLIGMNGDYCSYPKRTDEKQNLCVPLNNHLTSTSRTPCENLPGSLTPMHSMSTVSTAVDTRVVSCIVSLTVGGWPFQMSSFFVSILGCSVYSLWDG